MSQRDNQSHLPPDILLDVRGLKVEFPLRDGTVQAVNGVSFQVKRGKTLGIIGESGSGKSVTAQALMRLTPAPGLISAGEILLSRGAESDKDTVELADISATGDLIRNIRWNDISMIFQEPMTSFSLVHPIEDQITEAMLLHIENMDRAGARQRRGAGRRLPVSVQRRHASAGYDRHGAHL